ncbi:autotransporter domain-containing protein [Rhizobium daejeonense]|uniref:Autotransporter domain-containing protein n=1 Tax=Rhizobium daejeonense TaxID=240521 RepID=A0A6M1RY30_9HYPH|nr:autotransporter domain-containing protein [Rhizobium daejeonense]NGO63795.1 autotransporter domain-containing protein [Rhizobium daejeonense]
MTLKRTTEKGHGGARKFRLALIALMGSTALMTPSPVHAEFRNLGDATPDTLWYQANGVSGNGRFVVGEGFDTDNEDNQYSFLYDMSTGTTYNIGQMVPSAPTIVFDVSNAGAVVGAANMADSTIRNAFRWTLDGGFENLGSFDGVSTAVDSIATAISDDGRRVAGYSYSSDSPWLPRAFVWVEGATTGVIDNRQMHVLASLTPTGRSMAEAISGDGLFAAGMSNVASGNYHAVRWDMRNITSNYISAVQDLGTLGGSESMANGISRDGRVVIGWSGHAGPYGIHAFRWEEGGTRGGVANPQMEDLGTLGGESSEALAVNADGSIVVGRSDDDDTYDDRAFRWTRETGMIKVSDWLAQSGVDIGDVVLKSATGVSDDGGVIVGRMEDPESEGGETAFIARVAVPDPDPDPGHNPGPTPPPGIMNVSEYNRTLYDAGYAGWAGRMVANVPLTGAHHRPMMNYPTQANGVCGWTNGDIAHYDDGRNTGVSLAEAGLCGDLLDGTMRIGLGGGVLHSQQDLMNNGDADLDGQYAIGELNWHPEGVPVLFSATGLYGGWDADIHRGYSNGAAMAYSDGDTDMRSGILRLRADWQNAFSLGSTGFSPYLAYTWGRTTVDAYTETGGPFPSRFDEQVVTTSEIRLGLASSTELTSAITLRGSMELVHATGDASRAKGQVVGLYGFDLGGGTFAETWVRAGADIDLRVTENAVISLSGHAATEGLDAQISGAARFQVLF